MSVSMAGRAFSHNPGDIVEVADDVYKAWVEAGIGKPVKSKRETATLKKKETAVIK